MPSVPCHMGLPNTATCFITSARRGSLLARWVLPSYVTIRDVTSCHLYCILLVGNRSQPHSHLRGRDYTRAWILEGKGNEFLRVHSPTLLKGTYGLSYQGLFQELLQIFSSSGASGSGVLFDPSVSKNQLSSPELEGQGRGRREHSLRKSASRASLVIC